VSGPLEAYAAGFREELSTLGYSARSAAGHLQLMAHLSRWLVEIGLVTGELTLTQPLLDNLRRMGWFLWLDRRPRRVVVRW
jgi:integrase/recombinase XerD